MVAITIKGLHPTLGIWHHSVRNRFNLADDIIETLRPLVDYHVYQQNITTEELNKEQKINLLKIIYATVYWQEKPYSLKQAINLYIDEFISFMNEKSDIITPMELKINAYETE